MAHVTTEKLIDELRKVVHDAGAHADDYVRSNPWPAIGIGALAGLVVGILLARRGGSR